MPNYLVSLERRQATSFWIEADTQEEAQEGADALADGWDMGWDEDDVDVYVVEERRIKRSLEPGDIIWRGGEHGEWDAIPGAPEPEEEEQSGDDPQ